MKKKDRYFAAVLNFPFEGVYRIGVYRAPEPLPDPRESIKRVLDLTFADAAVCVEVSDFINSAFDASGEGARLAEKLERYAGELATDLMRLLVDFPVRRYARRFTKYVLGLAAKDDARPLVRLLKSSAEKLGEYRTKYSSGTSLCLPDPEYFIVY